MEYIDQHIQDFCSNTYFVEKIQDKSYNKTLQYYLQNFEFSGLEEGVETLLNAYISDIVEKRPEAENNLHYLIFCIKTEVELLHNIINNIIDTESGVLEKSFFYFERYVQKETYESAIEDGIAEGQYYGYFFLFTTFLDNFCDYLWKIDKEAV